jgi:hypothetical protein
MEDNAALLIDHILPQVDMRQWVISFPFQLRFLFANYPTVMNKVLGIVTRLISTRLIQKGGAKLSTARTGAVTFIQRFRSALNFMAKLTALVPKPRVNLTRFFGLFAPNSQYRMTIAQEKKAQSRTTSDKGNKTVIEKRHSMTWAKRLKRVFNIDIETCEACQGQVKIIACIEDPEIIKKILNHLKSNEEKADGKLPQVRAPPVSVFAFVN